MGIIGVGQIGFALPPTQQEQMHKKTFVSSTSHYILIMGDTIMKSSIFNIINCEHDSTIERCSQNWLMFCVINVQITC